MKKKIVSIALCLCFVLCSFSYYQPVKTYAETGKMITQSDINALREKLAEIRNERENTEKALSEVVKDEHYTESAIAFASSLIDSYIGEIENINSIISEYNLLISETKANIVIAQEEYDKTYDIYLARLRSSREDGDYTTLEILFNSESFTEFIASAERIIDALDYDERIMEKLSEKKRQLADKLRELNDYLVSQTEQIDEYESQKQGIEDRIEELSLYLDELAGNSIKQEEYAAFLAVQEAAAEKELTNLIEQYAIQKLSTAEYAEGEEEIWPLDSEYTYISSPYGYRTDPINGTKKFHAGLDIPASTGTKISATLSGIVITSSYMANGYGYYIVIDHGIYGSSGQHLYSIYAHCSKLLVKEGEKVKQGDVISLVGSTGKSTGSHLHFELRLGTTTVPPLDYVKIPG